MKTDAQVLVTITKDRMSDEELTGNGLHSIDPIHLLGTIEFCRETVSYSNYDCGNLDRLKEILLRYCEGKGIALAPNGVPKAMKEGV